MSKAAPKIDPSAWASQRDAKIQRANELREQRKRENQNQQQNPNNQPPPQQQSSPRNLAPPSDGWVGGPMGGAPAAGGRYKPARGGFTFAQQEPAPSQAIGDENDVRQQLWEMKEAAQQQRRSVAGVGYGQGASTESPVKQPLSNNVQSDWGNHQNHPSHNNVASSWGGGYDQPAIVEAGTRPPWLQSTPPRSSEPYNQIDQHGSQYPPSVNHQYPGNGYGGVPSTDNHYPPQYDVGYQPQQHYPQQHLQPHQQPVPHQYSQGARADGMASSPLRSRPGGQGPGGQGPGGQGPGGQGAGRSPRDSPSRRSNNGNVGNAGYMKVRTPRERHDPNGSAAPYSPIGGDAAFGVGGDSSKLLNSDDIAQQKHEEQLRELQRQQDALQEQQQRNLEQQKLLQQQQEEHQRKLKIKQQQKQLLHDQQKLQKQKEAEERKQYELKRQEEERVKQQQLLQQQQQRQREDEEAKKKSSQMTETTPSQSGHHRSSHRSSSKATAPPRTCLFSFTAEHKSELNVECGEPLRVLGDTTNNGWVLVERVNAAPKANGKKPKGYIPMSYVGGEMQTDEVENIKHIDQSNNLESNTEKIVMQETKINQQSPKRQQQVSPSNNMNGDTLINKTQYQSPASQTIGAATLLPNNNDILHKVAAVGTMPVDDVSSYDRVTNTSPLHGEAAVLIEEDILLRDTVDPNRDVGGGWADDFADASNPLDLAPRPLPKVNRKKKKDESKLNLKKLNNISTSPSHTAVEVHKDGSVAIRPNHQKKAEVKSNEKHRGGQEFKDSKEVSHTTPIKSSPKNRQRTPPTNSSESKEINEKETDDSLREDKDHTPNRKALGSSGGNGSPRSRSSRRSKNGKPPPPPPPPEEPAPPQKWDWEDIPIVSKASQKLKLESELNLQQTIPALTKEAKKTGSASWLEQPYGQPDSARSLNHVSPRVQDNSPRLGSPRRPNGVNPSPSSPRVSPRVGQGVGQGGGSAPTSGRIRRPRSSEDKTSHSSSNHQVKSDSKDDEILKNTDKDENEYGMNAMLRELHNQRRSRRDINLNDKDNNNVSNMRTMAVSDNDDVDNGGWQDGNGYEVNHQQVRREGARPRPNDRPSEERGKQQNQKPPEYDSNELIMDHQNHHMKPNIKKGIPSGLLARRPSPWRGDNDQAAQTLQAETIQVGGARSPRLGGNNKVKPTSSSSPRNNADRLSSPRNVKGGQNHGQNNLQRMLHDAKQDNRKDHGSAGGLGMEYHDNHNQGNIDRNQDRNQVNQQQGNNNNNMDMDRKRRKKPAPTPASGAVPLNVKNARRNAGDGDDHFPEDGSVVGQSDKVKKGRGDGTRMNFDKRTSRMKNARHFKGAIDNYKQMKIKLFDNLNSTSYDDNEFLDDDSDDEKINANHHHDLSGGLVKVFVRKRPLFEYEAARGEFDVISILNHEYQKKKDSQTGKQGYRGCKVLIHNCMMHPDMKRMYHKACWFPAHYSFGELASNPSVFNKCALPLVKAVSDGKGVGTLFMYGQTGSGKTHTMTGIEEGVAMSLSSLLHPNNKNGENHVLSNENDNLIVRLRFFELVGKRCVDLIATKPGVELKLMNDGNEAVRPAGAAEPIVNDAAHLLALLKLGKKRRATAPTDVNGGSSRSHAVCQIVIDKGYGNQVNGLLTLVDCAGSERKEDSMYHDKERQKESTEINASLYALKECVRARALAAKGKNVQIPFRSSSLTKVLMESFVRSDAHLTMIATVSPIPTDTEHSISTLRTVCAIAGYNDNEMVEEKQEVKPNLPKREERVPPIKWTAEQLLGWVRTVNNGRFASVAQDLPRGTSGKVVMRWGAAQFSAICGGPKVGGALQKLLQDERARCDQLEQLKRQDRLG